MAASRVVVALRGAPARQQRGAAVCAEQSTHQRERSALEVHAVVVRRETQEALHERGGVRGERAGRRSVRDAAWQEEQREERTRGRFQPVRRVRDA